MKVKQSIATSWYEELQVILGEDADPVYGFKPYQLETTDGYLLTLKDVKSGCLVVSIVDPDGSQENFRGVKTAKKDAGRHMAKHSSQMLQKMRKANQ